MDYINVLRKANILDKIDINNLENTRSWTKYYCAQHCLPNKVFTMLHHLVCLTNKYPALNDKIKEYLELYPEGINKVNEGGWTALHLAATNSNTLSSITTVICLLEQHADINIRNEYGSTVLINMETFKYILMYCVEYGVNINTIDKYEWTALTHAVAYFNNTSNIETIKYLLKCSADPNIKYYTDNVSKLLLMSCVEYDAIPNGKYRECVKNIRRLNTKN